MRKFFGFLLFFTITNSLLSQQLIDGSDLDSITTLNIQDLSNFTESLKAINYDDDYESWISVRSRSPKYNEAIYADKYAGKLMKYKISTSSGQEKIDHWK